MRKSYTNSQILFCVKSSLDDKGRWCVVENAGCQNVIYSPGEANGEDIRKLLGVSIQEQQNND